MNNQDTYLPPLSDRTRSSKKSMKSMRAEENPFYVYLDEDIFKVKEMEAQARKYMREANLKKSITEKSLQTSHKLKIENQK